MTQSLNCVNLQMPMVIGFDLAKSISGSLDKYVALPRHRIQSSATLRAVGVWDKFDTRTHDHG